MFAFFALRIQSNLYIEDTFGTKKSVRYLQVSATYRFSYKNDRNFHDWFQEKCPLCTSVRYVACPLYTGLTVIKSEVSLWGFLE